MAGERALHHVTARSTPTARAVETIAVAASGLSKHQRAYVVDGLARGAFYRFFDTFDELDHSLSALAHCDALILALEDARGREALPTVSRVTREWPGTAVVIFCPPRLERSPSIRALALAGAHQFVFEGVNDTAATVAQAVDAARRECVADAVLGRLLHLIPAALHSMVHAVLARPEIGSVAEVAASMGVHRKTLVNRCARSGFLQPGEVIVWCRLAMVGQLLERTGATVESISLTLGFASHTALRNLIKRHTGQRATEIRMAGGVSAVLAALERRLTARPIAH